MEAMTTSDPKAVKGGEPIALHGWWNVFLVKDEGGFVIKVNSYGVDQ
jgi:hypothetical protein